jgi:NAD(P)-dependent dehydrogenase (short-subunit alcohol dehydrogenase family)
MSPAASSAANSASPTPEPERRNRWTAADMPDQSGRHAIVTGANSGLGLHTAAELAIKGATVTLAVRDVQRGELAAEKIRTRAPQAEVDVAYLDLADLSTVRAFAQAWRSNSAQSIDLLINNAGIMAIPYRVSTDGYEMQFATNHLGHFALTGLLLDSMSANARVVNVSSQAHRMGRINFDDLSGEKSYSAWRAYGQSKLANLLFTSELQRRLDQAGLDIRATAAHPGYANTNLQAAAPTMEGRAWIARLMGVVNAVVAQPASMGALPTLYAATVPDLAGDTYIGPGGIAEQRGHPKPVGRASAAKDAAAAARLWQVSADLTGVHYLD